jgi:hypothetical protein
MATITLEDYLNGLSPQARAAFEQKMVESAARGRMDDAVGGRVPGALLRGGAGAVGGVANAAFGLGQLAYKALPGDAGTWADRPLFGSGDGLIADGAWQSGTAHQLGNFGGFIASLAGGGPLAEARGVTRTALALNPMARAANMSGSAAKALYTASRLPKLLAKAGGAGEVVGALGANAARGAGHLAGAEFFTANGTVQERAMRAAHAAPAGALFGVFSRARGVRDTSGKLLTKPADVEAVLQGRGPKLAQSEGLIAGQENLARYSLGQFGKGVGVGTVLGPDSAPIDPGQRPFTGHRWLDAALFHGIFMGGMALAHGKTHKGDAKRAAAFDKAKEDASVAAAQLDRNTVDTATTTTPGIYAYVEPTKFLRNELGLNDTQINQLLAATGPGRVEVLGKETITDPISGQESTGRVYIKGADGLPVVVNGEALSIYRGGFGREGRAAQKRMFEEAEEFPVETIPTYGADRRASGSTREEVPGQGEFDFATPLPPKIEPGTLPGQPEGASQIREAENAAALEADPNAPLWVQGRLFDQYLEELKAGYDPATAVAPQNPTDFVEVNDWISMRFEDAAAAKAGGAIRYLPEGYDIVDTPFGPAPRSPGLKGQYRMFDKRGRRMPTGKGKEKGAPTKGFDYWFPPGTPGRDSVDSSQRGIAADLVARGIEPAMAAKLASNKAIADDVVKLIRDVNGQGIAELIENAESLSQMLQFSRGETAYMPGTSKAAMQNTTGTAVARQALRTFPKVLRSIVLDAMRDIPAVNRTDGDLRIEIDLSPISVDTNRGVLGSYYYGENIVTVTPQWFTLPRSTRVSTLTHELAHQRTMYLRSALEKTTTPGILNHFLNQWGWVSRLNTEAGSLFNDTGGYRRLLNKILGQGKLVEPLIEQVEALAMNRPGAGFVLRPFQDQGVFLDRMSTIETATGKADYDRVQAELLKDDPRAILPPDVSMEPSGRAWTRRPKWSMDGILDAIKQVRREGLDEVLLDFPTDHIGRDIVNVRFGDGDAAAAEAMKNYADMLPRGDGLTMMPFLYLGDKPLVNAAGQKFFWIPMQEISGSGGRVAGINHTDGIISTVTSDRWLKMAVGDKAPGIPMVNDRHYGRTDPTEFVAEVLTEASYSDPVTIEGRFPGINKFINAYLGGWGTLAEQRAYNEEYLATRGPLFEGVEAQPRVTMKDAVSNIPEGLEGRVTVTVNSRDTNSRRGGRRQSAAEDPPKVLGKGFNPAEKEVQRFMSTEYGHSEGQFDKDARSFAGLASKAGGKKIGGSDMVDPAELDAVMNAGLEAMIEYGRSWKPSWATDPKIPSLREYYRAAMKKSAAEWRQVNTPGGQSSPVKVEVKTKWTPSQLRSGRRNRLVALFARGSASFADQTATWKKWQRMAVLMRYGPLFPLGPNPNKVFPGKVTSRGVRPWTIEEIATKVDMSERAVHRFLNEEFPMGKADHPSPYDPTRQNRGPRTLDVEAQRLEATRSAPGQMTLPGIDRDALFEETSWVQQAFDGKITNEEFFAGNEAALPLGGVRDRVTGHLFEPGQTTLQSAEAIGERVAAENAAGLVEKKDVPDEALPVTPELTEVQGNAASDVKSSVADAVEVAVNGGKTKDVREAEDRAAAAREATVLEQAGDTVAATAAKARAKMKMRGMTLDEFATLSFADQIRHASARFNAAAKDKHYKLALAKYAKFFAQTGRLMPILERTAKAKGVAGRREAVRPFEESLQVDIHYDASTPGTIPHWRIKFRDSGAVFRARDIGSVATILDLRFKQLASAPELTPPEGQHIRLDTGPDGQGPRPPGPGETDISDGESGGQAPMVPAKADLSHTRAWEGRLRAVTDWAHALAVRSGDTNLGVTINEAIQAAHEMAATRDKRLTEFDAARKAHGIKYERGTALGEAMAAIDSAVSAVLKITKGNIEIASKWVEANEGAIFDDMGLSAKEQSFLRWIRKDYLDQLQKEFGVANYRPGYFPFLREQVRSKGRAMEDTAALVTKKLDFFADFERRPSTRDDIVRNVNVWDVIERYTAAGYRMKFFGERPGAAEPGMLSRIDALIDQFIEPTMSGHMGSTPPHSIRPLLHLKRSIMGWVDPRRAASLEARDLRMRRRKDRVERLADRVDEFDNPVTNQVADALQRYGKELGVRIERPDAMLWSDHFLVLNRARTFGLHGMRAIRHVTQSGFTVATRVGLDWYGKAFKEMLTDPAVRARVYAEATASGSITAALPDSFAGSTRGVSMGGRLTKFADKTTFLYNSLDKWERGLSYHAQASRSRWAIERYKKHGNPMQFMEESRLNLLHPIVGEVVMRHVKRGDFEGAVREHARQLVKHSIFDYSRVNAPDWAHGVWGRVFGQYGRWPLAMLENMHGMVTYGTEAQRAEVMQTYAIVAGAVYGLGQVFGVKTGDWIPFVHTMNYNGGPAVSLAMGVYDLAIGDKRTVERVHEDFKKDPMISILGAVFRNVIPAGDVMEALAAEGNFNRRQRRLLSLSRRSRDRHELVARLLGFRPTSDPSHMKTPLKDVIESLPPLPGIRENVRELTSWSGLSFRNKFRKHGLSYEPGTEVSMEDAIRSPAADPPMGPPTIPPPPF